MTPKGNSVIWLGLLLIPASAFMLWRVMPSGARFQKLDLERRTPQNDLPAHDQALVSGLGVIQPVGENRTIFAKDSFNPHPVVETLFVDQGDAIKKGQVLAYLKGHTNAVTRLQGMQNRLPTLSRLVELRRHELSRNERLLQDGAGTDESAKLREIDLQNTISQHQQLLAEIENTKQDVKDLAVRSPVTGVVLRLTTQEGERISPEAGLMVIAPSPAIEVKAEIYENKAMQIGISNRATIISEYGAFSTPVIGQVTSIGQLVGSSNLRSIRPSQQMDARVVEVRILTEEKAWPMLQKLIGSSVIVKITTNSSGGLKR